MGQVEGESVTFGPTRQRRTIRHPLSRTLDRVLPLGLAVVGPALSGRTEGHVRSVSHQQA